MFCPKCGNKIDGSKSFCPDCGEKIKKIEKEEIREAVHEPKINGLGITGFIVGMIAIIIGIILMIIITSVITFILDFVTVIIFITTLE